MNAWAVLLFAASYTTTVNSDEHQGSVPSPEDYRKGYSSGSHDQITGESSPRTIFIYPPNRGSIGESRSGHHEDAKYSGSVNRPGILHSRYSASFHREESSKNSQFNDLPLQPQRRTLEEMNSRDEDSRYHGSSRDSIGSHQNSHHADTSHYNDLPIQSQRRNQEDLNAIGDDSRYPLRSPLRDSVISPLSGHHTDNSHFNDVPLQVQRRNQGYKNDRDDDSRYHGSSRDSVVSHHNNYHVDTSKFNDLTPQSQRKPQEDMNDRREILDRHHGSLSDSVISLHNGHHADIQEQLPSKSVLRAKYVHVTHDHKEDRGEHKDSFKTHNSRSNPSGHNSFSAQSIDHSFDENPSRGTFVLPSYKENREQSLDGKEEDLNYHNSKSVPSVVHVGFSPNSRDQPFDVSSSRATYVQPHHHGSSEGTRDGQQISLKYHNPTSNPSVSSHNGLSSSSYDHSFDKSTSRNSYDTQQRNFDHLSPASNLPAIVHSGISSNPHDLSSDKIAPRGDFAHSPYEGKPDQIRDGQLGDFQYHRPTSSQQLAFHSDSSSNFHDQSSDISTSRDGFPHPHHPIDLKYQSPTSNPPVDYHSGYSPNALVKKSSEIEHQGSLFNSPHKEIQRDTHDVNQEHIKYNDRPSLSSDSHSDGLLSKIPDQLTDESFPRSVIIRPPLKKNYWDNYDGRQDGSRYDSTESKPFAVIHDGYQSNAKASPVQSSYHFTNQDQQPFGENTKASHDFGYQNPTFSSPKVLHNSYLESVNDDTRPKDRHQYSHDQYGESPKINHNKQFEKLRYQDHDAFPHVQKDSFVNTNVGSHNKVQDHTRYHNEDDISVKPVSEHNELKPGQYQGYESHVPFHGPTALPYNNHPAKNQHFPKYQQSEPHNSQDDVGHSEHFEVHPEYLGYVPYSGPFTRPQVLNDVPNTKEVASVTVKPFGAPKAEPPRGFRLSSYLNNQLPADHSRPNSPQGHTHSFSGNQQGEKQNTRNNGFSGNGYSPFAPPNLYGDYIGTPQGQSQRENKNQTDHFPITGWPQTHAGYTRGNNYSDHYSSEPNRFSGTHNEHPSQHSYTVSDSSSPHQQGNLNAYIPHNFTRNEQIIDAPKSKINPSYYYEGEYINPPVSNNHVFLTGNHHEPNPHVSFQNSNADQPAQYDRYNSTKSNNLVPFSNSQSHSGYQNGGGSYNSDRYSSGPGGHSGPYQEHPVHQVPPPTSQVFHQARNNTNSERFNVAQRFQSNGGYHDGNDPNYPLRHSEDQRIQQEYNSQDYNNVPFTNHQLRQNGPLSNSPVVNSISADNFTPPENVRANPEQPESGVHAKRYPSVDHLLPGIHHEYALKFSINRPKPVAQALRFIPNSNQSEPFTVTRSPLISPGYLDSRNQHPSGLVGYTDNQHGYPYHTLPGVKPIVLESGYQEDTHEISHAKHDHLHVHHSSQSGYQYGIIN